MPIPSDTIALPIIKGLDVTTDARLVTPPSLLEAENTQFSGGGAKKRVGHTALRVRGEGDILPEQGDAVWVFGLGTTETGLRGEGEEDISYYRTSNPNVGELHGVFSRDAETVVWDGSRLFSYLPSQLESQTQPAAEVEGEAVLPSLHAKGVAKFNEHQTECEMADTGEVRLVAWVNENSAVKYALYDSTTESLIARGSFSVTTGKYLRVFTLGEWIHTAILDEDDDKVKLFSINSREPNDITYRSYGSATHFDVYKVSETEAVITRTNDTLIQNNWVGLTGTGSPTRPIIAYEYGSPALSGYTIVGSAIGLLNELGVAWYHPATNNIYLAVFDADGDLRAVTNFTADPGADVQRITVAPHFSQTSGAETIWELFWDQGEHIHAQRFWISESIFFPELGPPIVTTVINTGTERIRYNQILASRAWPVGDRVFVWSAYTSTLQSTWLLLDEGMKPVGHMDFGVAEVTPVEGRLAGLNFNSAYEWHLGLGYKLRVVPPGASQATGGIYTESSIKAVYQNFLPSLNTAQAGRATYIAGAQLWSYDGQEITEAGFHIGPEPTLTQTSGGSLYPAGTYSYRVDLCYRNAQNEEVRSLSILSNSVELVGGNRIIEIELKTLPTRRDDAYFLIFRNAMEDGLPLTEWWLLNSRDPADPSYLRNNLAVETVFYTDNGSVSDTTIQTHELHPATDTYLQPVAAPACEVITSGRDRLWVAGGELSPGIVAPSRLFDSGEIPSFNAYLNIQVDRSVQPITALGFTGEVAVIFREGATHLLDSDGPDNVAQGLWNPPRLALSDVGAVSQASVARISMGLLFQSRAGIRLIQPGGALMPGGNLQMLGQEVDDDLKDFEIVGVVVNEKTQEVRFYGASGAYVLNYMYGTWAHWSCGGVGVAKTSSGAVIAREDGYLWIETPGVYTDGGATYSQRIRTSWLHAGNLGDFQRLRWVGGLGRFADLDNPLHTLRLEIFYDERAFWEERIEWAPMETANSDTWGAANWGDGIWGDTGAEIENLDDLAWEWTRRPSRQKCSVFSVALEDVNTDGPGFELSAFTFDLARKPHLDRTQDRGGTGTYRS